MMEKQNGITLEHLLYGLILTAALLVRMALLGEPSLLEQEASWAYQAWQVSQGEAVALGSRVAYLAVTEALFSLFGGSDFLARFWPALAGSLVVGIPYLFRRSLGAPTALVLAAGFALDPALVGVSRIAGGGVPALVFLGLALGALHRSRFSWAVFFTGLGLLSGPDFWLGFLIGGISLLAGSAAGLVSPGDYLRERGEDWRIWSKGGFQAFSLPLLALALLASFFLTHYQGLGAWAGAIPELIASWTQFGGTSALELLVALPLSSPLALVFGLVGFGGSWLREGKLGRMLSVWFAVSLLMLLIYPGRQPADLIWVVLPLWTAGAAEAVRIAKLAPTTWLTYTLGGVVAVLAALNWLTFIGLVFQIANSRAVLLQLGLLGASIALVILSMTIIGSEWDWRTAWKGLAAGTALTLGLLMVSALTLDAYLWEKDPRSLYSGKAGTGQMDLLRESISDASLTLIGRPDSIQGAVIHGTDLLRWSLRDFEGIGFAETIDAGTAVPVLITPAENFNLVDPELYRGQDFVISTRPGWTGILPPDWISWIAFRSGPIERDHIILWVRNDINSGY